jgi:hypothetical protein
MRWISKNWALVTLIVIVVCFLGSCANLTYKACLFAKETGNHKVLAEPTCSWAK